MFKTPSIQEQPNPNPQSAKKLPLPKPSITTTLSKDSIYLCPLCLNYLVKSVQTTCGHIFCQFCLSEYLLFFSKCFLCGAPIRNGKYSYSYMLDLLVTEFIQKQHAEESKEHRERIAQYRKWVERKNLKELEVGKKVDIRDQNYIWCTATITRLISRINEPNKFLKIHYDHFLKKYDEEVDPTSARVAQHGFYTSRLEIPRYEVKDVMKANRKKRVLANFGREAVVVRKGSQETSSEEEDGDN